jgi:hypothetical protein
MQYGCSRGMSIKTYRFWGARSWVYAGISAAAVLSTGRIGLSLRFTVLVTISTLCFFGCEMPFYPWLAVLGSLGAKQCGCKMTRQIFILGLLCLVLSEPSGVVAR